MKIFLALVFSTALVFTLSCSKSSEDSAKTGTVKLQMANSTAQLMKTLGDIKTQGTCPNGFNCIDPVSFQMKILAAYVVEDIDPDTSDNVGQVGMVWLNPACSSINDCSPSMVEYSDLTDPVAFNEMLNSQALGVSTGTYKYVRLEFCQSSADSDNVKVDSGSAIKEFTYGGCGVTSAELTTPITLDEGESITVEVSYELNDGEAYWVSGSGTCASATDFCLGGIDLVPSIVQ